VQQPLRSDRTVGPDHIDVELQQRFDRPPAIISCNGSAVLGKGQHRNDRKVRDFSGRKHGFTRFSRIGHGLD
jgi:hypothetical protein